MVGKQNQRLHQQLEAYLNRCFRTWAHHAQDDWRGLCSSTTVSSVQIEVGSVRCQERPQGVETNHLHSTRVVELNHGASEFLLQLEPSGLLRCIDLMLGSGELEHAPAEEGLGQQWTAVEDKLLDWLVVPWCKQLVRVLASDDVAVRTIHMESASELQHRFPSSGIYYVIDLEITLRELNERSHHFRGFWSVSARSLAPYLEAVFGGERTVRQQHELVAVMARSTLTDDDVRQMEVGDVIATEVDADGKFSLELYGTPLFSIEPGVAHGKKAVRIVGQ